MKNLSASERQELERKWSHIVAKAWADTKFKDKLMQDPCAILVDHGIEVPSDLRIKCVEDTKGTKYLILPEKPKGSMSEGQLKSVAAAGCCSECCCAGSYALSCCCCCE